MPKMESAAGIVGVWDCMRVGGAGGVGKGSLWSNDQTSILDVLLIKTERVKRRLRGVGGEYTICAP